MKNTQTLKANHLSKNGVIIADDTDIVFLNVDKNNRTIKTNLKNIKNRVNHSISNGKRLKSTEQKCIQQQQFRKTTS